MSDFSADSGLPRGLGTWLGMGNRAYKLMVAIGSLITTIVLTLGKLILGLLSGSLALIADALQGLIDILVTSVTVLIVRQSDRGTDPAWTCGREKLEAFAALAEAVLLGIIAAFIWHLAGMKLLHGTGPIEIESWYLIAALTAAGADFVRHIIVKRAARATGSMALEANAAHFLTDALGTILVTLGLLGAWYGFPVADTFAALGVAGLLSFTAFNVGQRALGMLLDRIDPATALEVLEAIECQPEIARVPTLRIRRLPERHVVDLIAEAQVDTLEDLARIEAALQERISAVLGTTELCAALRPLR